MPMDKSLYPDNWDELALAIKTEANWQCQACGRPCRRPDETFDDLYQRLPSYWEPYWWSWEDSSDSGQGKEKIARPHRFKLTVAHMDHRPENCYRNNLRAWCTPCHARYDLKQMGLKRALKAERAGQLRIEGL